jgi:acetyl-CoA acetyltransferase
LASGNERQSIRRQAAIVGIGQTELSRRTEQSVWELAIDAVEDALADAGIDASEVDGLLRYSGPFEAVTQPMLAASLGLRELRLLADVPLGGDAVAGVVGQAAGAIASGQASVVVAYRAIKQSDGARLGQAFGGAQEQDAHGNTLVSDADNRAYMWPYGVLAPVHVFALWATRYMHEQNLSFEQLTEALGTVAIQQRAYANTNPRAIMRDRPMDRTDYEAARMISWPLRLFDMCLENDGACAIVLVSSAQAAGLPSSPAHVLSATQSLTPFGEPMGNLYAEHIAQLADPAAIRRLYADAGVQPGDVSVAALYDATSFMVLRSLEIYGFADAGFGWRHLIEHGIGPGSPLPVNTHGGHLSEGYVHGMTGVLEAVRQLRGTAANQVADADVALMGTPTGHAMLLGR